MIRHTLFFTFLASVCCGRGTWLWLHARTPPVADPTIPDDGVRVAVSDTRFLPKLPETAMRIRTSKFRRQMETIRQLGITVISLNHFIAWKRREKNPREITAPDLR